MTATQTPPPPADSRLTQALQRYAALHLGFLPVLVLLRLYEYFLAAGKPLAVDALMFELKGFAWDLPALLIFSAVLFLPFLAVFYLSQRAAVLLASTLLVLAALIHTALLQYFATAVVPLGADLFGYSLDEILLTVRSTGGVSPVALFAFAWFAALAIACLWLGAKIKLPRSARVVYPAMACLSFFLYPALRPDPARYKQDQAYYLEVNKSDFFYTSSLGNPGRTGVKTDFTANPYPLLKENAAPDVLGPFFRTDSAQRPNLVFVMVEGLGGAFTSGGDYAGFMPFLDSLAGRSLYWDHFLSTSGRTFQVLPSVFGSLPFGENGFMDMGADMPAHTTLIALLREQGYFSSYYYGGNVNFDRQDVFLERQGIDFMLDENEFGPAYKKSEAGESSFSWGYADGDVFKRSLEVLAARQESPRLDMYMTLSSHEPFLPPNKAFYRKRFEQQLAALPLPAGKRAFIANYPKEFSTLMYVDDALRAMIKGFAARPDFASTIFFITGDHRLIPVPHNTRIDKFHVPFVIYSPLLKGPARISSVSSHRDITPSLLAFLQKNYGLRFPSKNHWLGTGLDTARNFGSRQNMAFMRNKNEMVDYLKGTYFLSGNELFRLTAGMGLEPTDDDAIRAELETALETFRTLNDYVCRENKLIPAAALAGSTEPAATPQEDSLMALLDTLELTIDQQFELARQKAFSGQLADARLICRKILRNSPNYSDVRILLGRTYAWDKQYEQSETTLKEALRRSPRYDDAYNAMTDLKIWSEKPQEALGYAEKGLAVNARNEELLVKKVKILSLLGRKKEALKTLDLLKQLSPGNPEITKLENIKS